jgi:hypothetical protein
MPDFAIWATGLDVPKNRHRNANRWEDRRLGCPKGLNILTAKTAVLLYFAGIDKILYLFFGDILIY